MLNHSLPEGIGQSPPPTRSNPAASVVTAANRLTDTDRNSRPNRNVYHLESGAHSPLTSIKGSEAHSTHERLAENNLQPTAANSADSNLTEDAPVPTTEETGDDTQRGTHLADHFVVCGIDRTKFTSHVQNIGGVRSRSYDSKVFTEFPVPLLSKEPPITQQAQVLLFPHKLYLKATKPTKRATPNLVHARTDETPDLPLRPKTQHCTVGDMHSAVLTDSRGENMYITCLTLCHKFLPTAAEVAADSDLTDYFLASDLDDCVRLGFEALVKLDALLLAREFKKAQACNALYKTHMFLFLCTIPYLFNLQASYKQLQMHPDFIEGNEAEPTLGKSARQLALDSYGVEAEESTYSTNVAASENLEIGPSTEKVMRWCETWPLQHPALLQLLARGSYGLLRQRLLQLHKDFAPELHKYIRTQTPMAVALFSRWPQFQLFERVLRDLHEIWGSEPMLLQQCMHRFMCDVPMPARPPTTSGPLGVHVAFTLAPELGLPPLELRRSPVNHLRSLGFSLNHLFKMLDVENVVDLVACVLSEQYILVISEDLSCLTKVTEALKCLIQPFEWLQPYVPVLPSPKILHCPVPIIAGATPSLLPCDLYHLITSEIGTLTHHDYGNNHDVSSTETYDILSTKWVLVFLDFNFIKQPDTTVDQDGNEISFPHRSYVVLNHLALY